LENGETAALHQFWHQVSIEGTPIIEPDIENDQFALVTFLHRGDENTRHVVLHSEILRGMWWNHWDDALLYHISGTDIYYRTYRLPTNMRFVYWLSPNRPLVHIRDDPGEADQYLIVDPLNPRVFVEAFNRSYVEMPAAPPQPWWHFRPHVPAGVVKETGWHSDRLDNDRRVWIYTPPGYAQDREPYRFLLLFDGDIYTTWIPAATILNNLAAEEAVPPMVAVMIDSPDRSGELYCNNDFVDCLTDELIPWIRRYYNITHNPGQSIAAGVSAGGLAAAYAAMCHPETFGNVLSNSGAFHWSKEAYSADQWSYEIPPEDCWLPRQFATCEKLPIRFHLDAGLLEDQRDFPHTTLLRSNRYMRDVLTAKGYWIHYQETCAGHQYINWRGTFPEGLIALFGRK
jgi:enterochelin esterase family protein